MIEDCLRQALMNLPLPEALDFLDGATCAPRANKNWVSDRGTRI